MDSFDFTYTMTWAGTPIAEMDGRAIIEDGEIAEIELANLSSRGAYVSVGGDLEKSIRIFLGADDFYAEKIRDIGAVQAAERRVYDREIAHAAE
jgi:hypothetical protein